jgi:hypothetical protein
MFCLAGCEKHSGEAVVRAKEHIAAAPPISETSPAGSPASPHEISTTSEELRPIGDDEITADGYVMKPEVRGTSHDPRALKDEQWRVKVRMINDGRTFNVQAEQGQFDKLKGGDRGVHVSTGSENTRRLSGTRRSRKRRSEKVWKLMPSAD